MENQTIEIECECCRCRNRLSVSAFTHGDVCDDCRELQARLAALEAAYDEGLELVQADTDSFDSPAEAGEWLVRVGGRALLDEIAAIERGES